MSYYSSYHAQQLPDSVQCNGGKVPKLVCSTGSLYPTIPQPKTALCCSVYYPKQYHYISSETTYWPTIN